MEKGIRSRVVMRTNSALMSILYDKVIRDGISFILTPFLNLLIDWDHYKNNETETVLWSVRKYVYGGRPCSLVNKRWRRIFGFLKAAVGDRDGADVRWPSEECKQDLGLDASSLLRQR